MVGAELIRPGEVIQSLAANPWTAGFLDGHSATTGIALLRAGLATEVYACRPPFQCSKDLETRESSPSPPKEEAASFERGEVAEKGDGMLHNHDMYEDKVGPPTPRAVTGIDDGQEEHFLIFCLACWQAGDSTEQLAERSWAAGSSRDQEARRDEQRRNAASCWVGDFGHLHGPGWLRGGCSTAASFGACDALGAAGESDAEAADRWAAEAFGDQGDREVLQIVGPHDLPNMVTRVEGNWASAQRKPAFPGHGLEAKAGDSDSHENLSGADESLLSPREWGEAVLASEARQGIEGELQQRGAKQQPQGDEGLGICSTAGEREMDIPQPELEGTLAAWGREASSTAGAGSQEALVGSAIQ